MLDEGPAMTTVSHLTDETESEEMIPLAYAPLNVNEQTEDNITVDEKYEINPANLTILPLEVEFLFSILV